MVAVTKQFAANATIASVITIFVTTKSLVESPCSRNLASAESVVILHHC